jgi:hypothetical protein
MTFERGKGGKGEIQSEKWRMQSENAKYKIPMTLHFAFTNLNFNVPAAISRPQ